MHKNIIANCNLPEEKEDEEDEEKLWWNFMEEKLEKSEKSAGEEV